MYNQSMKVRCCNSTELSSILTCYSSSILYTFLSLFTVQSLYSRRFWTSTVCPSEEVKECQPQKECKRGRWVHSKPLLSVMHGQCDARPIIAFPAHTHGGIARLNWPGWLVAYRDSRPKTVTYPGTNWAQCRVTTLIETNALPLSQTANQPFIGITLSTLINVHAALSVQQSVNEETTNWSAESPNWNEWIIPMIIW